jgi:DNA repair photolyase
MSLNLYSRPLTITSQFSFCGLPLRLDSYAGCAFRCSFCFARYRGGNNGGDFVRPADSQALKRIFERAFNFPEKPGIIAQFLRRRVPIHFGGMSDPFQPAESRYRITESYLQTLAIYEYPTVISTRSSMISSRPYLDLLRKLKHLVVQFSFSSTQDQIARIVEPFSSPPSELLQAMERLVRCGIRVTCRWQPYIKGVSESTLEFVSRVASTGCIHVGFEHLKLPVERQNPLWKSLNFGVGRNLHQEYMRLGARRDGREFVLPIEHKLPKVLEVATQVRRQGMTFGAADNEVQFLSDTDCCCSGVDQFPGFENWFRHQIGFAVRKCRGTAITYSSVSREWCPSGSIDRFLNENSRLSARSDVIGTIRDHIKQRWNNPRSPGNPASFYGVRSTNSRTSSGQLIYRWDLEPTMSSNLVPEPRSSATK